MHPMIRNVKKDADLALLFKNKTTKTKRDIVKKGCPIIDMIFASFSFIVPLVQNLR